MDDVMRLHEQVKREIRRNADNVMPARTRLLE